MSRRSLGWGIAVGVALVLLRLAARHYQNQTPAPPPGEGPLLSASAYVATPENSARLGRYLEGVLSFTLLHEIGHMIISEHHVPVLGREEDAADRFAVMFLSRGTNPAQRAALLSATAFFSGLHRMASPAGYDWTDQHGEPQQRAFSIICLTYGSDPEKYAPIGEQMGVSRERLQQCVAEAGKNGQDWGNVFQGVFDPSPLLDDEDRGGIRACSGVRHGYLGGRPSLGDGRPVSGGRRHKHGPDEAAAHDIDVSFRVAQAGLDVFGGPGSERAAAGRQPPRRRR